MAAKPTYVLVPGAWHTADCWTKVTEGLKSKGFLSTAVSLPSTKSEPSATLLDDITATRQAIQAATSQGQNVVVVSHSYGGLVGASSIKGLDKPETPSSGRIIGFVVVTSGFSTTGMSFMDLFEGVPPPFWTPNKETGFADLVTDTRTLFYHDIPVEEGELWASKLTPHSLESLYGGAEHAYAGWKDVPTAYIAATEDQAFPVLAQRMVVQTAREQGKDVIFKELATSHSPFLSQPDEVVTFLVEVGEKFSL